jgi:glycosyltransferase involved in cell wall biosynthesis
MITPLISIIIPVYNGEKYVSAAIDSALSQTYKNFEIIVVNDGSKDSSDAICKSYDNKIKYFLKENGGCGSALNYAIQQASGEYISWLSHDDVYHHNKLEIQVAHLNKLKNKDTILYGPYDLIDENSNYITQVTPHRWHKIDKLNTSLYPLFKGLIGGCTMLIPKNCFKNIGNFDETLLATQDYDLWLKFLKVYPISYITKPMVKTRLHSDQGSKVIPTNITECNSLWCRMIDSLSEKEMLTIEPNIFAFFHRTTRFLKDTPYEGAYTYSEKKTQEFIDTIKVSVVIPFKDRFPMVHEAINSVKLQTHKNIELILVDDGSEKDSIQFTGISPEGSITEVQFLKQENKGPAAARNSGVFYATGDFIAFLDSDDLFVPEKIQKQLYFMLENSLDFSFTSYDRYDLENKLPTSTIDAGGSLKRNLPELIVNCPIATPTVMGKKDVFLHNPFPTNVNIGEDVSAWLYIASKHVIDGIPDSLTIVRIKSTSASVSHKKQIIGLINIACHIASSELSDKYPDQFKELLDVCSLYIKENIIKSA